MSPLEANIYSPEFRSDSDPSFETTKNWAIIFDVLGFVFLVYGLLQKATIKLRIRKLEKQGAFKDEDQVKRFNNLYSDGQTATKWAFVLLLCEDIPEAAITVHVIKATGSMSTTAWVAVITSCLSFLMSFLCMFYNAGSCGNDGGNGCCAGDGNYYYLVDVEIGEKRFGGVAPSLVELLGELIKDPMGVNDSRSAAVELSVHA